MSSIALGSNVVVIPVIAIVRARFERTLSGPARVVHRDAASLSFMGPGRPSPLRRKVSCRALRGTHASIFLSRWGLRIVLGEILLIWLRRASQIIKYYRVTARYRRKHHD